MQLQPHFLFNTLHAIAMLTDTDPAGAETMAVKLAELLRATLRLRDVPAVPLEHDDAAFRPRWARLHADERPQVEYAGHAALLVHHPEKRRRRARDARDGRDLGHPAHRRERQCVPLAGVDADDGAHLVSLQLEARDDAL